MKASWPRTIRWPTVPLVRCTGRSMPCQAAPCGVSISRPEAATYAYFPPGATVIEYGNPGRARVLVILLVLVLMKVR